MRDGKAKALEEKAAVKSNKKPKKSAAMARADYDSAFPSKKTKKKKLDEKAAAAAVDFASPSFLSKKKMKKTKEEKGQTKGNNQQQEEESQIKKIPSDSEVQTPWLFLVVRHAVRCPAYSLYRLKHPLGTADNPRPDPCRIKYLDADHDMSFATMSSQRRSWIVGVGGFPGYLAQRKDSRGQTIVFDCKSGLVAKGPRPTSSKSGPVLFVVGEKVYALTRMPNIWRQPYLPPWFEVLDVSDASHVDGELAECTWLTLPSPPLFPILNMEGVRIDRGPAIVEVESYAVVGHYILLSIVTDPFTDEEAGTVAFDTATDKWHYVDRQKNLPFVGEAVPHGGLYLGKSKSKESNDLTAYNIVLTKTKTKKGTIPNLSIEEIPITIAMTGGAVTSGQFFSSLGNGVIGAVGCSTDDWDCNEKLEMDDIYFSIHRGVDGELDESKTQWPREIMLSNKPAM